MSNWLESEETNDRLLAEARHQEGRRRREIEGAVEAMLAAFHGLCNRVNLVRGSVLTVSRLEVIGNKEFTVRYVSDQAGTTGRRAMLFDCANPKELLLVVGVIGRWRYWDRDDGTTTVPYAQAIVRKVFQPLDLANWQEARMLETIKWLLCESDTIDDCLPGVTCGPQSTEILDGWKMLAYREANAQ